MTQTESCFLLVNGNPTQTLPLVSALPGDDIRLSVDSVPLTRENVYLGVSPSSQKRRLDDGCLFPSRFRGGAITSTVIPKSEVYRASIALAGSGVPVGATHCPDLVYTALFGEFPCHSKSEGDFCSSHISTTEVTSRKADDCCDASRSSEGHVRPCSGHQNMGFFGSSDPAQEGYGDTSRYWVLNIRVSDLLGSGYRVQDPVEGEVKGNLGGQCLVYSNGATAKTAAIGNPMATAPTAPLVQIYWFTLQSAPMQLDLSSGSIRSPPNMDACLVLVCWMVRTPIPLMLVQLQAGLWLPFPRASADTGWARQSHDLVMQMVGLILSRRYRVTVSGPSQSVHLSSDKDIHLGVISSSGTDSFGAISAAENSKPVNDVRTVVAHRCNASDVAGNSKDIRCGSTLSCVAGHMGAFSATNFSEIINHHGSLSGIGSGDFPPLCPFIKVALGKQKAVSKASTPSGEANACHYAPSKHVFNAITGVRFPDVQEDVSLSCVLPALSQPVRSVSSSGKVGKSLALGLISC